MPAMALFVLLAAVIALYRWGAVPFSAATVASEVDLPNRAISFR